MVNHNQTLCSCFFFFFSRSATRLKAVKVIPNEYLTCKSHTNDMSEYAQIQQSGTAQTPLQSMLRLLILPICRMTYHSMWHANAMCHLGVERLLQFWNTFYFHGWRACLAKQRTGKRGQLILRSKKNGGLFNSNVFFFKSKLSAMAARRNRLSLLQVLESVIKQDTLSSLRAK